uniref:Uncharacterized protein n=1 Tax=Aegilops tauschii TaxID=37682 RepID=R7W3E8_AEGTA
MGYIRQIVEIKREMGVSLVVFEWESCAKHTGGNPQTSKYEGSRAVYGACSVNFAAKDWMVDGDSNRVPPAFDEAPRRYPGWVLLDSKAYFAHHENATTAQATAITGRTVKVTFCLADPPALSHFCVHGPWFNREDYAAEPRVLSSEKDLVLLGFVFTSSLRSTGQDTLHPEYFVYRAGRGKLSLTSIPATPLCTGDTLSAGIVPQDDIHDEGGFLLADLVASTTLGHYELSVFSSRTATWTTQTLQLHASAGQIRLVTMFTVPHKVIALGRGMLGWVDLWRGIMACNILAEEPFVYFIPLPKPDFNLARKGDPKPVRDVACFNGVIKLVEIDHFFRRELVTINHSKRFKVTRDLDSVDMIHHSEILLCAHEDFLGTSTDKIIYIPDGWKIRTCYMHIFSDVWCKGQVVHVDDILLNDPRNYMMLPQLWDGSARKFTSRILTTAYPTLTIHGGDVIYLTSKVDYFDKNSLVVGVDLGKKTVEILKPYSAERAYHFKPAFFPCAFSEYLNTTPRQAYLLLLLLILISSNTNTPYCPPVTLHDDI